MSHDHVVVCRICQSVMEDLRDCDCIKSPLGYSVCASCKHEEAYEKSEKKRNAVY